MNLFNGRLATLALLTGMALSLFAPLTSHAAGGNDPTAGCAGSWRSGNGDHSVLLVDCAPGFATSHDRIYVYPRRAIATTGDWRRAMDTADAVWLFDVGAVGRASLLIDFHPNREGPGLVADLYDDPHGSGRVDVRMVDGTPAPMAKDLPTVRVTAPDGWWVRDKVTNFNLNLGVDGPIFAAFGANRYLDRLARDGRLDFVIQVRDRRGVGRPDFEWIDAWPDAPSGWQLPRTELMVNTAGDEPPIEGSLFWPYLGTSYDPPPSFAGGTPWTSTSAGIVWLSRPEGARSGFVKDYGRSFPPIQVLWPTAKIATVGEFVASRGNGSNYFVYSTSRLDATHDRAAFENPFAFYDLAGAHDGHPDLAIRSEYNGAYDPAINQGRSAEPVEMIRYSWDQFHRHHWDFKVDLLGRHVEEGAVALPGLILRTIPYETLPGWVTSQTWDAVNFVAVEGGDYISTEGIYESLNVNQQLRDSYLTGRTSTPPPIDEAAWPAGLRGESRIAPGTTPDLYFSPVDHRLHLLGADCGLWRVDETRLIRYANVGGDYIDVWSLVERGAVTASLTVAAGQAVLSDGEGVSVKTAPAPSALFRVRPPTNHEDWSRLGALLLANRAAFAGDDLKAMFDAMPDPAVALRGASSRDYRTTTDGFQFVLTVPPARQGAPTPLSTHSPVAASPQAAGRSDCTTRYRGYPAPSVRDCGRGLQSPDGGLSLAGVAAANKASGGLACPSSADRPSGTMCACGSDRPSCTVEVGDASRALETSFTGDGGGDYAPTSASPVTRSGSEAMTLPLRDASENTTSTPTPIDLPYALALSALGTGDAILPATLAPGSYLVRYQTGTGYAVERMKPVALSLSPVAVQDAHPVALAPVGLDIAISNTGHADAPRTPIAFTAAREDGVEAAIGAVVVADVPAEEEVTANVEWTPPAAGTWSIGAHVESNGSGALGFEAASPPVEVFVASAPAADVRGLLAVGDTGLLGALAIVGLLVAAMAVAASLAFTILEQVHDAPSSGEARREYRR